MTPTTKILLYLRVLGCQVQDHVYQNMALLVQWIDTHHLPRPRATTYALANCPFSVLQGAITTSPTARAKTVSPSLSLSTTECGGGEPVHRATEASATYINTYANGAAAAETYNYHSSMSTSGKHLARCMRAEVRCASHRQLRGSPQICHAALSGREVSENCYMVRVDKRRTAFLEACQSQQWAWGRGTER